MVSTCDVTAPYDVRGLARDRLAHVPNGSWMLHNRKLLTFTQASILISCHRKQRLLDARHSYKAASLLSGLPHPPSPSFPQP